MIILTKFNTLIGFNLATDEIIIEKNNTYSNDGFPSVPNGFYCISLIRSNDYAHRYLIDGGFSYYNDAVDRLLEIAASLEKNGTWCPPYSELKKVEFKGGAR